MAATNTFLSNTLGALQRMTLCDGVGIVHGRTGELAQLLWVEDRLTISGALEDGTRPRLLLFSEEWQLTLAQAASLASLPSSRLDG